MPLEATCRDCGEAIAPTEKRPDRCPRHHQRHLAREWRKRTYHQVIKHDPVKLAAHRRQARDWARNRKEAACES